MPFPPAAASSLIASDLATAHAASATDLVPGAPARALVIVELFVPAPSQGRTEIAVLGLAPGAPGQLPVPTAIEYLRYTLEIRDDGSAAIAGRPDRADLVQAVTRVLADEDRAFAAAEAALVRSQVALPQGTSAWRAALRRITYDSRLPAAQFGSTSPSWSFIFEPWSEGRGFNQVILNDKLGVQMINGRTP